MSTTSFLVRRLSRQNDEYDGIDFHGSTADAGTISEAECSLLMKNLSDSVALPASCKLLFERAKQNKHQVDVVSHTDKKNDKPSKNYATLRRKQSYVAMHDYPPTAC